MAGERTFLQVPPDSTGKRVKMRHHVQLNYSGLTAHTWVIGGTYTTTFSDASEYSFTLQGYSETTVSSGILEITIDKEANYANLTINSGADIDYGGSAVATAGSSESIYANATEIIGGNNQEHSASVDNTGSLNIRFSEGLPQLDSFGKLRTSGATILGDYTFSQSILSNVFSSRFEGGGTVTFDSTKHSLLLTNTTASGDLSSHRTNTYHHYVPGSSQLFVGTVVGSASETNLVRHWGLFDDEDGFMFSQLGTDFGIQLRSNITGSVVNTFTLQTDFNIDTVDGTGPSGFALDLTKDNIFWIDLQWLGAGRIRYGCYDDFGQRITMHEIRHANSATASITTTGSLPVSYYQKSATITYDISIPNKQFSPSGYADAALGSTAEFRAFAASVFTEIDIDIQQVGRSDVTNFELTIPSGTADGYSYMGTLSPKEIISGSNKNRSLYWPSAIDVMALDSSGNDVKVNVSIYAEPVLSNLTFSSVEPGNPFSTVEKDTTADYYGGGAKLISFYVPGHTRIDLKEANDNMFSGAFKQYADNGGTKIAVLNNITVADPAVATMDLGQNTLREGEPLILDNIVGTMSTYNGDTVYLDINALGTAELYTDAGLTTGLDTTGLTYTSGGDLTGDFGGRLYFTILVEPVSNLSGSPLTTNDDIDVRLAIQWKEINQ